MLTRNGVSSLWGKPCPLRLRFGSFAPRPRASSPLRPYSQAASSKGKSRRSLLRPTLLFCAAASSIALGGQVYKARARENDSKGDQGDDCNPLARVPFATLLRGYFVYTCCGIPLLVDCGPAVVDWCKATSLPGVWPCFEFIVRHTFFPQVSHYILEGCYCFACLHPIFVSYSSLEARQRKNASPR
jgi:hypothetical protein